jgi:hypothetical protein
MIKITSRQEKVFIVLNVATLWGSIGGYLLSPGWHIK